MARPLRSEVEGALYHVTSRGNAGQDIFLEDSDRTGLGGFRSRHRTLRVQRGRSLLSLVLWEPVHDKARAVECHRSPWLVVGPNVVGEQVASGQGPFQTRLPETLPERSERVS